MDKAKKKSWYKRWWAIVLFIFIGLLILGGLVEDNDSTSTQAEDNNKNPTQTSDSSLNLIKETKNTKIYSIDCDSFNSNPELYYIKSSSLLGFYSYIPAKEFSHDKYIIGSEQVEDEEMIHGTGSDANTLTKNESIQRHGKYCSFGRGTGQNINYLYCEDQLYSAKEISEGGEILSLAQITISTVFSINNEEERKETNGGYALVDDASLVSQECTISIPK